jgi:hypothetical protein
MNEARRAVVLSNQSQFFAWAGAGYKPEDFLIFCDNPRFHDGLEERGIAYRVLDELLLKEEWASINAWGCAEVSRWMKLCREERVFSGVDLSSVVRHFFAMTLIPAVKNYRFAERILAEPRLCSVMVFESSNRRKYPFFSGNAHLNYFLKENARRQGLAVTTLTVHETENLEHVCPMTPAYIAKTKIKNTLKKIFNALYRRLVRAQKKTRLLAHGSLRHLASTLETLKKRGEPIAIYDFEFHAEQFRFALRHHVPYLLPESFGDTGGELKALSEKYHGELKASLASARRRGLFHYDGHDLSDFIETQLFYGLEEYTLQLARWTRLYEKILKCCNLRALVVDEDYALRGAFLAGFMKLKGVELFCVSHANLGVDFAIPESDRIFQHSWTLVHSEFERDMYAVRGWDPSKFVMTGTPRYDRLIRLFRQKPPKTKSGKIRLLYTATGLWKFSPDQHGYLGCHFVCYGDFQIPAFKTILESIEGLPIELLVKPHSAEAVPLWHRFVAGLKPKNDVRVASHADDYFKMLTEADAMILSYWSTGLLEAALCDIPTFFVRSRLFESSVLKQFSDHGYCYLMDDGALLKENMRVLCEKGPDFFRKGHARRERDYYLGLLDARGTERAADWIQGASGARVVLPRERLLKA